MKSTTVENRINWWFALGSIIFFVIVLAMNDARAGELGFRWAEQEYPYPLSYEISSGGEVLAAPPAGGHFVLEDVPDGCQSRAYEIRAVGHLPDGTLLRSEPATIQSMARPVIGGVVFDNAGVYSITGDNFGPLTTVTVNGELVPDVDVTCSVLTFEPTVGTPAVVLVNAGGLLVTWTLPAPLAPISLEVY